MYTPYIRITTGNVQTVLDNVAKNPVGCIYSPPAPQGAPRLTQRALAGGRSSSTSTPSSTSNPAPVAAALRTCADETFHHGDR